MKKLIALIALFTFAAVMSYAAESVTDTGTAKAKIVQAATLEHQTGALDFGVLIADTDGGSVFLDSVATPTAADTGIRRATGAVHSDHFILSNLDTGTTYTVSIPANVTIKNADNETMSVATKLSDATVTGVASKDLYVGGTLTIGGNQPAGVYTGDYTMEVTY